MNEPPFPDGAAIRPADVGDATALGAMRAAQQAEITGSVPDDERRAYAGICAAFFARELAVRPAWLFAWVALVDRRAVGVAVLALAPGLPRLGMPFGPDARIRDVYVEPAFRRRGLARALTQRAIACSGDLGVARLTLGTSPMGRSLYRSLGFVDRPDEMLHLPTEAPR